MYERVDYPGQAWSDHLVPLTVLFCFAFNLAYLFTYFYSDAVVGLLNAPSFFFSFSLFSFSTNNMQEKEANELR